MTVHAENMPDTPDIKVHFTSGSLHAEIRESYQHLRTFWSHLGQLIEAKEREQ